MIEENLMEKIISLAKRRGFIFQGSEIYGGLAGTWDYGPLGAPLKRNIEKSWIDKFINRRSDMYLLDAAILMNKQVWETTGHTEKFSESMVECPECQKRYRADQIDDKSPCCGKDFEQTKQFNLMFQTKIGASEDSASISYLRPETAQGIFVNFKNVMDTMRPKLPFGIAQIGKAFRNEITPRDFIFRTREFEQMEIEYFVQESDWNKYFEYWKDEMLEWMEAIGLDMKKVHELDVPEEERAHYSEKTIDFEFDFPFGRKELYGLAYRGNYDLSKHSEASGEKLEYVKEEEKGLQKFVPHVIEPSFGMERTVLALLISVYREDEIDGEKRSYLSFSSEIAPYKVAVSPLLKNKPELVQKAEEVFGILKSEFGHIVYDDNGNIGKRYRRQDEIGTPYCVTIDFDTLEDDTVTVRDRNTTKQDRIKIKDLKKLFNESEN